MFRRIWHWIIIIFYIERVNKFGLKFILPNKESFIQTISRKRGYKNVAINLKANEQVTVHVVNIKDAAGLATTPASPANFTTANPELVSIIVGTDGLSATYVAKSEGTAAISVELDGIVVTDSQDERWRYA